MLGAMFPLPRILYAMGSDGIIFKTLANVHPKTMTPIVGTVISGLFTGVMTLIFNLEQLIDMMSIGTLLAYTIVAVSVLILRYIRLIFGCRVSGVCGYKCCVALFRYQGKEYTSNNHCAATISDYKLTPLDIIKQIVNVKNQKEITEMSNKISKYSIVFLCKCWRVVIEIGEQSRIRNIELFRLFKY